jgi:hypothetical protein
LGFKAVLPVEGLLGLDEYFVAFVGGWGTTTGNVLLDIVRDCRVVELTLDVVVNVFAGVARFGFGLLIESFGLGFHVGNVVISLSGSRCSLC